MWLRIMARAGAPSPVSMDVTKCQVYQLIMLRQTTNTEASRAIQTELPICDPVLFVNSFRASHELRSPTTGIGTQSADLRCSQRHKL